MNYIHVEGSQTQKPLEYDADSSESVVYIRKNIRRITREEDGEEVSLWAYDEAKITHEEYEEYRKELESPSLELIMQHINDVTASQELADITAEMNHEEQMQLLNDIQADIALMGLEG